MFSARFAREVIVTRHARQRMDERGISETVLLRVIDEGQLRYRDATHLWAWLNVTGREDNLLCAVLVLEDALVVKTVLHHWEPLP